jgi:CDGSH-type Zn-finger protein
LHDYQFQETEESSMAEENSKRIIVSKDGPYCVPGNIPLVSKTQIVSEFGEPIGWKLNAAIERPQGEYHLCRCGGTSNPPFCDGTHRKIGFDGTETADTGVTADRSKPFPNGTRIYVKKDNSLCIQAGFCGLKNASLGQLIAETGDTRTRSLVIAMVERCPSGALTYRIEEDGTDIEPDLPQQVAVTVEITSDGPIAGPLWVTGGIPVERSDGQLLEARNRVTLCNCGNSSCKPLCDGSHRYRTYREARRRMIVSK